MNAEKNQGYLNINSTLYNTRLSRKFLNRKNFAPANPKEILSYIPGVILEIFVAPGMDVNAGQDLMTVEAMKMKNRIKCGIDGRVKSVAVEPGSKVGKGTLLLELE